MHGVNMDYRRNWQSMPKTYDEDEDENECFNNPLMDKEMGRTMSKVMPQDNIEEEEAEIEKDMEYMKRMYSDMAKEIAGFVEDECDKLEYEGSCMFHEYPDKTTIYQIADSIYGKVKYHEGEEGDSCLQQQDHREPRQPYGNSPLNQLVQVMLWNEMHCRRRRYKRRRRMFY